jgi:hypothetical protein
MLFNGKVRPPRLLRSHSPLARRPLRKSNILFITLSPPTLRGEDGALRQVRGYKQFINDVDLYMAFMALQTKNTV